MPHLNKYISMSTQIKNKDEQTSKSKKVRKNEKLLDSNPHLLSAKDSLLSIRLSRKVLFYSLK